MVEEIQNGEVSTDPIPPCDFQDAREDDIRQQLANLRGKQAVACSAEIQATLKKYGYRFQVVQEWRDGVPQPTEIRLVDAR